MQTDAAHALIRFGLGPKAGQPSPSDPHRWLAQQLDGADPDLARPAPGIGQMLTAFREDRRDAKANPPAPGSPTRVKTLWGDELAAINANLVETDVPFRERLVWFWANHFTVSTKRGEVTPCLGPYLREAIRPHVTGRFADMLMAVMTHPAMLIYLDNNSSVGPNSDVGRKQHRGLNENLARECLELHTVSPAAGYSQADVTAFAAVLTGWSVETDAINPGFVFKPATHEPGPKTVMGQTFPPGREGGVAALTWLADHPATHRHLAQKLVRHFVADDPPPAPVDRVSAALRDSRGDLRAAALAVASLPQGWTPLTKLRTPFDYVPAVLRASNVRPDKPQAIAGWLSLLGQPAFGAPLPNGWADTAADWSNGEALLRRVDWAWAISDKPPGIDPAEAAQSALGPLATPATLTAMKHAGSRREALTLLLTSPEFFRR